MVLYQKAGFAATALSWIVLALVGAMPFWLSREIPSFSDAMFETVSGFTTTGATILTEVEHLSHGMLMWRSLMNFLGGMGVIVFLLALIPRLGGQQNIFLMKAESPGPIIGKTVPHMRHYAAMLYGIYIGMTALECILLLFGGMDFFNAINTSFATAGTGGFGVQRVREREDTGETGAQRNARLIGGSGQSKVSKCHGIFLSLLGVDRFSSTRSCVSSQKRASGPGATSCRFPRQK